MKTTSESKFGNNIVLDQNKICQNCTLCLKTKIPDNVWLVESKQMSSKFNFADLLWLILLEFTDILRQWRYHLHTGYNYGGTAPQSEIEYVGYREIINSYLNFLTFINILKKMFEKL